MRLGLVLEIYRAMREKEVEQWKRRALEADRNYLDLLFAWRISLERPEVDVRDELDAMIRDSRDHIAKMEEWV